jgi:hypothetical protein
MKICIVIQSEPFRESAGMRIRYDRFRAHLGEDDTIEAMTCADLAAAKSLDHDAYVFCKTFDTSALLLARKLRAAGKVVGQDLFDDYFSQTSDTRLERFRQWLRDMAPVTDFALCSTSRMGEVLRQYMPDTQIAVIEDPVIGFDADRVGSAADQKTAAAAAKRQLNVLWFGIGDNPFFRVGLADLAACDAQFALMEQLGWKVNLTIVTNRRPFEGAGAEILRPLSVPFELIEWSEAAEEEALAAATVAILPVNGQAFSRAKSLNRAISALNAGCQVLSIGYPLYERLGEVVYRSARELISDLEAGRPRLCGAKIDLLAKRLKSLADPAAAASAIVTQARRAKARAGQTASGPVCLIHGRSSSIGLHKNVSAIGGLSVKTIFTRQGWNFPVRFDRCGIDMVMRVTPQIAHKFSLPLCDASVATAIGGMDFVDVDGPALGLRKLRVHLPAQSSPVIDLAIYEDVMRFAQEGCSAAFPGADILISDASPLVRIPPRLPLPKRRSERLRRKTNAPADAAPKGHAADSGNGRTKRQTWPRPGKFALTRSSKRRAVEQAAELLRTSSLFDPEWYLSRYPDVAQNGSDPARHYLEFGWREGRNPSAGFSTRGYLKAHPDVAAQKINPLLHYLEYGQVEGRKVPPVKGAAGQ